MFIDFFSFKFRFDRKLYNLLILILLIIKSILLTKKNIKKFIRNHIALFKKAAAAIALI